MRGIFQKDLEMMNISKSWILLLLASVVCLLRGVWSLLGVVFLLPFWLSLFWNKHHDFGLVLPWKWYHLVLSRVIWLLITLIPAFLSGILWMILDQKIFRVLDALAACGILLAAGCALLLLCLPTWLRKSKTASKQSGRKSTGVYIKILAVLGYAMVAAGFCIFALIMFTFGGMRLTPQAAAEAWNYRAGQWERIEFGKYTVFYTTDYYTSDGFGDERIDRIIPVERLGIFYHGLNTDRRGNAVYITDICEVGGEIFSFEEGGHYHNFYITPWIRDGWTYLDFLGQQYETVTVNGQMLDMFKQCYFVTDAPVQEFEINGVSLTSTGYVELPSEFVEHAICFDSGTYSFLLRVNGMFNYRKNDDTLCRSGKFEKTSEGIVLYFWENGEFVETVRLTLDASGNFCYDEMEFAQYFIGPEWDTYPITESPAE